MTEEESKKLDEIMLRPSIIRKASLEQTEECPIWNPREEIWEESDAQLRERLKHHNKGEGVNGKN